MAMHPGKLKCYLLKYLILIFVALYEQAKTKLNMGKIQLTGQNLGRVFNSRRVRLNAL
jgi:hypothetical protein